MFCSSCVIGRKSQPIQQESAGLVASRGLFLQLCWFSCGLLAILAKIRDGLRFAVYYLLEARMEYKPDKFDRYATRIIAIVMSVIFGAVLVVITIVRFADPSEELFSIGNVVKGVIALVIFGLVGFVFSENKSDDIG